MGSIVRRKHKFADSTITPNSEELFPPDSDLSRRCGYQETLHCISLIQAAADSKAKFSFYRRDSCQMFSESPERKARHSGDVAQRRKVEWIDIA